MLDEADFLKQATYEDRRKYVIERMGLNKAVVVQSPAKDEGEAPKKEGGRKVRRGSSSTLKKQE